MLTQKGLKLVEWLRKRKVATMRHLQHQFQVSHMTVFRALKTQGYHTSYNHNAAYYTLAEVPRFDDWGLWAYRNARFSRFGTLPNTLVALVQQAPAGLTCDELEDRLQTHAANLLSRLVQRDRLQCQRLQGRQVVYLAHEPKQGRQQLEQRQQRLRAAAATTQPGLPVDCSASLVIDVLRQMILAPDDGPEAWAQKLRTQGPPVTAKQVRHVQEHYALKKNDRTEPVPPAAESPAAGNGTTPAGRHPARRCVLPL